MTVTSKDIHEKLADHLSKLGMGFPVRNDLVEILKEMFDVSEAEVALAIPNKVIPLEPFSIDEIQKNSNLPKQELLEMLERLVQKGLLFAGKTKEGEKGYALLQVGFGFPQTFFWKGENTSHARKMASLIAKYFNRQVTKEAYSSETKPYRYIPIGKSIHGTKQSVYPYHAMETVIDQAEVIAVAHCPCRVSYSLWGRGCDHPKEVCMKFNDMARFVIDRELARKITKEEARGIIKISEEAGLVHFVDNAEGDIQHNCNCCGCSCWNVGAIRRRKTPRDVLMATYFIRETDLDACIGCGQCVEICPVDAVELIDDVAVVDKEWCIGCGVCAGECPSNAIEIKLRPDRTGELPAATFKKLHEIILEERNIT